LDGVKKVLVKKSFAVLLDNRKKAAALVEEYWP